MSAVGIPGPGDSSATQEGKVIHRCPTCKHSYKKLQAFDIHVVECARAHRERMWKLKRAFPLYAVWFAKQGRATPSMKTFGTSRFGNQFIKFVDWCDAMNVSSSAVYMRAMMASNAPISTWTTTDAYRNYIDRFDELCSVDEWLLLTATTINDLCEDRQIPTSHFYKAITPNMLAHMLRTKTLYPRYLICDPQFTSYLNSLPKLFAQMISDAIPDMYLQPAMDCDDVIKAVIAHLNT
jgi:hypothetical protein